MADDRGVHTTAFDQASFADIIGRGDKMRQVFRLIEQVAPTDAAVLIHGEHGTGKELVAAAIHQRSKRRDRPFIKINCAAIPADLLESELFGHRKGSFTGATADRVGLMELADGGSLLLDEIGEMPSGLQAKLLRVLQEREFRPLGSMEVIHPSFRLVSSTNVELETALQTGRVREDLFFRINTVTLEIPPLRERSEDIPLLVEHFRTHFAALHGRTPGAVTPDAMTALTTYRWPGNIRELEHVIERAVIVTEGDAIALDDLPAAVREADDALTPAPAFDIPPGCTLAEIEKAAIVQTLERTSGNKRSAARILGVYRPTLYNKLRKHNLLGGLARLRRAGRPPRKEKA